MSQMKTQELDSVPSVTENIEHSTKLFCGWSIVATETMTSTLGVLHIGFLLFRNTSTSPLNPSDTPIVNMIGCPGMMSLPVTCGRVRHVLWSSSIRFGMLRVPYSKVGVMISVCDKKVVVLEVFVIGQILIKYQKNLFGGSLGTFLFYVASKAL